MAQKKPADVGPIDPQKVLGIKIHGDGKVTRSYRTPNVPPSCTPDGIGLPEDGVLSKDITVDPTSGLWVRIFLPQEEEEEKPQKQRLPVVLYFHGGGFVLYSPSYGGFHKSCIGIAKTCGAIIVSVDYRLAPEHRIPAPYDDAVTALQWLRTQALGGRAIDPWFESRADFSRSYLMGGSAGGNIVYHLGLRILERELDLQPLRIVGMVMTQPFFGGVERTESETRLAHDKIVPLAAADLLWSLALPEGADRDHEFCNPLKRPSPLVGRLPRSLVAVEGMDPLHDRGLEFVKMLKESGVEVVLRRDPTGFHGVQLFDMQKAKELCNDLRNFINSPPPPSSL